MGRIWEAQKTGETTEMFDHETGDSGVPVPSAFHLKSREVGGGCANCRNQGNQWRECFQYGSMDVK